MLLSLIIRRKVRPVRPHFLPHIRLHVQKTQNYASISTYYTARRIVCRKTVQGITTIATSIPAYYNGLSPYAASSLPKSGAVTASDSDVPESALKLSPAIQSLLDGLLKDSDTSATSTSLSSSLYSLFTGFNNDKDDGAGFMNSLFGDSSTDSSDRLADIISSKTKSGVLSQVYSSLAKAAYAGTAQKSSTAAASTFTMDDVIASYQAYKNVSNDNDASSTTPITA